MTLFVHNYHRFIYPYKRMRVNQSQTEKYKRQRKINLKKRGKIIKEIKKMRDKNIYIYVEIKIIKENINL